MSSIFDDKDLDWADEYQDYVLRKKRFHKVHKFSSMHHRFNAENIDGTWIDEYDDFEIGLSKESWGVTNEDGKFIRQQDLINRGPNGGSNWRDDLPIDVVLDIEYEEEMIEEYDDDEEF